MRRQAKQFFANQFSSNELYVYLRERLMERPLRPTPAHEALCSMPVPVFVTTNYDDLIESQLRELGERVHVVRGEKDLAIWSEEREVQVLKLHGDLSSAEGIVLTDWDYVRFLCDKSLMKRKLAELFCYRTVVFIGYSLRDPNVSFIFNAIAYELGGLKRPAYIVTFDPDEHQQNEWRRRGVRPLYLDGSDDSLGAALKTELLTDLLQELSQKVTETNRSIMIVDDNEGIVRTYKTWLSDKIEGVRVHGAMDGHAAMYAIGKMRPRLLIVDVMMPKLDGWELIKMVRQFPELDETRIIVQSGLPELLDDQRARDLRIDCLLAKPVTEAKLLPRVFDALGIRHRSDSGLVPRQSFAGAPGSSGETLFPPKEAADSSSGPGRTSMPNGRRGSNPRSRRR